MVPDNEPTSAISSGSSIVSELSTLTMEDKLSSVDKEREAMGETEAKSSHSKTGFINCLTREQESKLAELWSLVIELFSSEAHHHPSQSLLSPSQPNSKSNRKMDKRQKQQLAETLSQNASTHSLSSIPSTSSARSIKMSAHPLGDEFWRQLATDDPDVLMLRFLRARKWNVIDAFFMFYEALKWRHSHAVYDIMAKGDVNTVKRELLECGKGYFWGYDREGRLVVILSTKLHDRYGQTLEENMAHTVWLMEMGRRCMRPGIETVTLIFDLADAPLSSFDPCSMQFMIECFQSYYPESLGQCYVVNAPWIFWGFWSMIKPWLDPVVAGKVHFIENPAQELSKYIAPEMLLRKYGGEAEFSFKFLAPLANPSLVPRLSLSEEEKEAIVCELDSLKTQLIDASLHLHSLLNNSHDLFNSAEPVLDARELTEKWRRERRAIVRRLRELLVTLDKATVPAHLYERMGLMAEDGIIEWDFKKLQHLHPLQNQK